MAYAFPGDVSLDYFPCRYGKSKILFRGPRRDLAYPFVAVLGGTETYGKFVPMPYPALVEAATGLRMVNLGYPNAGPDLYLSEPEIGDILSRARVTVIQIAAAQNLSNRFYSVHPRRNDRFLSASPLLKTVFREVDFTEFSFTRHMLGRLYEVSPAKFRVLADELRAAWVARMSVLLDQVAGKAVLLWMGDPLPEGPQDDPGAGALLVDRQMIRVLGDRVAATVEVVPSAEARAAGASGLVYPLQDERAAFELPGTAVHREVAAALGPVLEGLFE